MMIERCANLAKPGEERPGPLSAVIARAKGEAS